MTALTARPHSDTDSGAALLQAQNLQIEVLTARGWRRVVDGVSLDLLPGHITALVGETGSGKTLTALSLMGLLPNAARTVSGGLQLRGRTIDLTTARSWRKVRGRDIAMVFQDPLAALNPVKSVGFQLREPLTANLRLSGRDATARARELLGQVGIPNIDANLRKYPHELSGGMRQRVLIAMALACNPGVLIADEPTTALDVTIQAQILELIRDLSRTRGLAVLLVTHDLAVASQIADRILVMYAGKIVEAGPTDEVLGQPTHPYARGLLACVPRLDVRMQPMASLPGIAQGAWDLGVGCRFAPRCQYARDLCRQTEPQLVRVSPQHGAACWVFAPPRTA